MPVLLEGGCQVSELREGTPETRGTVRAWPRVGRATGASAISLRVLEFASGRSPALGNVEGDEVLYVLEGEGTILVGGQPYPVEPEVGAYLAPGVSFAVDNPGPGPLVMVSSRCPDPSLALGADTPSPLSSAATPLPMVRLGDRVAEVTGDRWYRVLVDEKVGSHLVTQFVGSIPPGRAPDHFHSYEEVLCILEGRGEMWAGESHTPIGPGSCVFLPPRQTHCVENTGRTELRLLGVFYPAGSPAVRYAVDGEGPRS